MQKNLRVLNVGSGGDNYGTDFVDVKPQKPGILRCDLDWEPLPYMDETFSEVYCKNVLEHLRNPGLAIREMFRVLKPGGELIIVTDNAAYFGYHVGRQGHSGYRFHEKNGFIDQHYSLFSIGHLKNHLTVLGLDIKEQGYLEFLSPPSRLARILQWTLRRLPKLSVFSYPRIRIVGAKKPLNLGTIKG